MKFIFEVKMKPGYTVEQYAAAWIEASEIIQRAPDSVEAIEARKFLVMWE